VVLKLQKDEATSTTSTTLITSEMVVAMDIEDSLQPPIHLTHSERKKGERIKEESTMMCGEKRPGRNGSSATGRVAGNKDNATNNTTDDLYIDTTNSCLQVYQNLYGFDGLDTRELDDVVIHNDLANCRHTFLEVCQFKNLQFDSLRRAKHSSALIIQYLHDPSSRRLSFACSSCGHLPEAGGIRWFSSGFHQLMFCPDCAEKVQATKRQGGKENEKEKKQKKEKAGSPSPRSPSRDSRERAKSGLPSHPISLIPIRVSFSGTTISSQTEAMLSYMR